MENAVDVIEINNYVIEIIAMKSYELISNFWIIINHMVRHSLTVLNRQ